MLAHLMPLGYAIGKYLPTDGNALKKRMDNYLPVLEKGAVNEEILLPNGHDQMPVQKNIFAVMEQLRILYPEKEFFLSRYEDLFAELEKNEHLDTIQGELLDGKYMRVHRSIFSTRADLKSSNTRIENKLTNILEPLASIAHSLGFSYEHGLIEAIWKEIMKNHAHDSIGCCCSDKVHKAIANRFFEAEDKTDALINYYMRKIVDAMECDCCLDKLTVFNLLPYARRGVVQGQITTKMKNFTLEDSSGKVIPYTVHKKEIVDAGLVDRQIVHYGDYDPFVRYDLCLVDTVPSMGYQTYLIKEAPGICEVVEPKIESIAENAFYTVKVNKNGSFCILEKATNKTYDNILLLEDGSDDGDEYDYAALPEDFIITSQSCTAKSCIQNYQDCSIITSAFSMKIPKDLNSRTAKQCDSIMNVTIKMTLRAHSPILELSVEIENTADDHRVRLLVPNGIGTKYSVSDNQFGSIRRPVTDSAMAVWEKENWKERPDSIYPMLSYVAADNETGLAVLTNSVREYEIVGSDYDTIAITLFRGVGLLGKEDLARRPGRPSGIKMETPDSQMHGKHSYSLALVGNNPRLAQQARDFTTPFVMYNKMPYNAMKLNDVAFKTPYSYSLLDTGGHNIVLSALKRAEESDFTILRLFQSEADSVEMKLVHTYALNKKDNHSS